MNAALPLDLRPLSVAELFDRTFRLYRRNFLTFLGIVVLTQIPLYLIQLFISTLAESGNNINPADISTLFQGPTLVLGIVTVILSVLFTQIGAAALTRAIADSYLGKSDSIKEAFQRLGRTWFTLIFALIFAGLIIFGLAVPVILVSFIPCIGTIAAVIGIFFVGITANIIISLLTPVVVLEKSGARDSVRRAWELGKKRFWWIFGYLLLLGILSWLIVQGPTLLILFLFESVLGGIDSTLQNIIEQSANLILNAFFLPIQLTAVTLMYFDLRIRFEGFDLMVLAATVEEEPTDMADLTVNTNL